MKDLKSVLKKKKRKVRKFFFFSLWGKFLRLMNFKILGKLLANKDQIIKINYIKFSLGRVPFTYMTIRL